MRQNSIYETNLKINGNYSMFSTLHKYVHVCLWWAKSPHNHVRMCFWWAKFRHSGLVDNSFNKSYFPFVNSNAAPDNEGTKFYPKNT